VRSVGELLRELRDDPAAQHVRHREDLQVDPVVGRDVGREFPGSRSTTSSSVKSRCCFIIDYITLSCQFFGFALFRKAAICVEMAATAARVLCPQDS